MSYLLNHERRAELGAAVQPEPPRRAVAPLQAHLDRLGLLLLRHCKFREDKIREAKIREAKITRIPLCPLSSFTVDRQAPH